MDFVKLKSAMVLVNSLKSKAAVHDKIANRDLDIDSGCEDLTDECYGEAVDAARSAMLKRISSEYDDLVEAIKKLGVTDIPQLKDWPTKERPL